MKAWLKRAIVLKWRGWRQFWRDMAVLQLGFLLFGAAIVIMVRANLGTSPWVALQVALIRYIPITLGLATIGVALFIIALDMALGEPLGWGTLMNMIFIGVWVDVLMPVIPSMPPNLLVQLPFLLLGVFIMGLATAIYVGVEAGAGPRDSLMLAVSRRAGISVRAARTAIEVAVVTTAWLLGGSVGLGTLIFALTVGPSVQLGFRLLGKPPIGSVPPVPAPAEPGEPA